MAIWSDYSAKGQILYAGKTAEGKEMNGNLIFSDKRNSRKVTGSEDMKTKKTELNNSTIFVTGAAGFIGSNLIRRLLKDLNCSLLIGIDNLNDYYDTDLKEYRLGQLTKEVERQKETSNNVFLFERADISNRQDVEKIFKEY